MIHIYALSSLWHCFLFDIVQVRPLLTRKSSCLNTRGIPTVAHQVLHLLPEVWYPSPGVPPAGVPPARSDRWVTQGGVPHPPAGVPQHGHPQQGYPWPGLTGGYPRWSNPWPGLTGDYPKWDTPQQGYPSQVWQGGVPKVGYPFPPVDLAGVPLPPPCGQTDGWMDGQTRVKTLPSRRTTYAVGKNPFCKTLPQAS